MIATTVTITTSPTVIIAETQNATRTIYLEPVGNDIHIGGSAVTTTIGLVTKKDVITPLTLPPQNGLWGVTAAGTVTLRLMYPEGDF